MILRIHSSGFIRFPCEAASFACPATTSGERFIYKGATNNVNWKLLFIMLALFVCAMPIFAQGNAAAGPARTSTDWVAISSGFAMAIASAGCGLGMGRAIGSATEGMARNPGAAPAIRGALILGLVLIESLALYVIVIIFVKVVP